MNLQEIKNNYAVEQGYEDWEDLMSGNCMDGRIMEIYLDEICIRAQEAALEKAAENAMVNYDHKEVAKDIRDDYGSGYWVHKESITNPENLIR